MDAISLLRPHAKFVIRPPSIELLPQLVANAYRHCWYGRPGVSFVDLPGDLIRHQFETADGIPSVPSIPPPPTGGADPAKLFKVAQIIKGSKAPLVVVGKGAAYSRAEGVIREFIDRTKIPFLPSPMGKGVVADSHHLNATSMRSKAMQLADVVLIFGARLNWMFAYGLSAKWNPSVQFIQVDISSEEIGRNNGSAHLGIVGDLNVVVPQLLQQLSNWQYDPSSSSYTEQLMAAKRKNEEKAAIAATRSTTPMSFPHAYKIIKDTLDSLSAPPEGGIVFVAEGSNTMDISRASFAVEHPRLRLDAGTYATMGLGLGYAIAAHEAYNGLAGEGSSGPVKRKKVVALEGDSAFGFSAMEVETMARYGMDVLVFVMNNGGIYQGDTNRAEEWFKMQEKTLNYEASSEALRSWSLGWEVKYEKLAEACGGKGYFVRTPEELEKATREGFAANVPVIVNVIIEHGQKGALVSISDKFPLRKSLPNKHTQQFVWQNATEKGRKRQGDTKL